MENVTYSVQVGAFAKEPFTASATIYQMEGDYGTDFEMDVMEAGDEDMMEAGDEDMMEADLEAQDENQADLKVKFPKQRRRVPPKRMKVKDYMCFSIITLMCFNFVFLGYWAMRLSLRVSCYYF